MKTKEPYFMGCVLSEEVEIYVYPNAKLKGHTCHYSNIVNGYLTADLPYGGHLRSAVDTFYIYDTEGFYFRRNQGILFIDAEYFIKDHEYRRVIKCVSGPIIINGREATVKDIKMRDVLVGREPISEWPYGLDRTNATITMDHVQVTGFYENFRVNRETLLRIDGIVREIKPAHYRMKIGELMKVIHSYGL